MAKRKEYDFSVPVRILRMRANGLDVMVYTFFLCILLLLIFLLLCFKGGVFGVYLDLWRVLVSIPLIILVTFVAQLLRELRTLVPKLAKQEEWTIEQLMALTGKDRKETERIVTRVLESAFVVDPSCEKQV